MANAGGMAVQRVVAERWKKATGIPLVEANGLTETSPGAICLRSPQLMAGYWNHPDETALAFTRKGWLRTEDMGFMDERWWFKIIDRKKDMIVVSGFKVFPNQVEDVVAPALLEHCRQHPTGCKVPRFVEFSDEPLPKTAIGKVLSRQLREASRSAQAAADSAVSSSRSAGSVGGAPA